MESGTICWFWFRHMERSLVPGETHTRGRTPQRIFVIEFRGICARQTVVEHAFDDQLELCRPYTPPTVGCQ